MNTDLKNGLETSENHFKSSYLVTKLFYISNNLEKTKLKIFFFKIFKQEIDVAQERYFVFFINEGRREQCSESSLSC